MALLGYLPKLERRLRLFGFVAYFFMIFHKNVPYFILYQVTKFQYHTVFSSQGIKQNVLLSSYLYN